jgi:hypothetical protein
MQEDKKEEMDNIGRSDDKTTVGRFSPASRKPTPVFIQVLSENWR